MTKQQTQFTIKVSNDLKKTFLDVCRNQDTTASQEIRNFMRAYIAKNGQGKLL